VFFEKHAFFVLGAAVILVHSSIEPLTKENWNGRTNDRTFGRLVIIAGQHYRARQAV